MLYFERRSERALNHSLGAKTNKPILVFLHGFLGSGKDWEECLPRFSRYEQIVVDLPGHGQSKSVVCHNLTHCSELLYTTLSSLVSGQQPLVLIAYSMGARILMHALANQILSNLNIRAAFIEGGNFGLKHQSEKKLRLIHDEKWASRFNTEPIEWVLNDWYQQSVFSSLNNDQRQILVTKRSVNIGASVANMLVATSLAKQSYLLPALQQQNVPLYYICGEKDKKFSQMAEKSGLNYHRFEQSGHNVHQEQPDLFSRYVNQIIHAYIV
ncbi:2-succinyl-6-hydroxy-2,4-cyclohexadiene-1-carboxylate synthase [Vibrio sagamiensis]|uniref:Putative 2-succinyl-6-hydroxy-2,4-cyclohexadiene-1-carboxylate synthase n=1 Tax=Vibrio sagamiensis NBRC 104589 TaxID=1219064 RepID=A0A511QED7_9VIBR|nr:2-succinyl-6-hydroxy-2,4-cyclohexadiene-1-carboxylate synthase [Vibrio sagamiensis]PNQ71804.1 2-succinyl-6-hydroxy-2,4-cyclohexadiene-1-carboxylate synthase [Vibrio agarivorans]GEM74812.1 putative 2-succinyl-6-hydroxy-2,4-cyclohexadiene-1-carboxylate synthase [Vibrio sagamiensis NBRC 104589]